MPRSVSIRIPQSFNAPQGLENTLKPMMWYNPPGPIFTCVVLLRFCPAMVFDKNLQPYTMQQRDTLSRVWSDNWPDTEYWYYPTRYLILLLSGRIPDIEIIRLDIREFNLLFQTTKIENYHFLNSWYYSNKLVTLKAY